MEWYFGDDTSTLERKVESLNLNALDGSSLRTQTPSGPTTATGGESSSIIDSQTILIVGLGTIAGVLAVALILLYRRSM